MIIFPFSKAAPGKSIRTFYLAALLFCLLPAVNTTYAQSVISPNYANIVVELRMTNDGEMFFRGSGDPNHGLGWYGITPRDSKVWNGVSLDGPVLYGYDGGALGTNHYGSQATALRWNRSGQVIIGNVTAPSGNNYSLYVEKGILTEHIRVAVRTTGDWSDQVFDARYSLMPLGKLQQFITRNHHLPGIPSAAEVVKEGIDLQQMDSRLLQKVEELTLYVLQQQQEIEKLKQLVQKMQPGEAH